MKSKTLLFCLAQSAKVFLVEGQTLTQSGPYLPFIIKQALKLPGKKYFLTTSFCSALESQMSNQDSPLIFLSITSLILGLSLKT